MHNLLKTFINECCQGRCQFFQIMTLNTNHCTNAENRLFCIRSFLTRLKRLPVISCEHFRKTRTSNTNCYFILTYTNCYFKYQLLLQIPIVTSNTNCYFIYQLVLIIPIVTSNTNCYFIYQLVLIIPIVTSNTNCYFKYQLLLQIPIVTSNTNCYFKYQLLL
jgi:hypothetical protein